MFEPSKVYERIKKYPVISFDIFDTLLKRNVSNPIRIFDVVEAEYNRHHPETPITGYAALRVEAERRAKEKCDAEEITFEQIYDELPYDAGISEELKRTELQTEYQYCQPNYLVKDLYIRCIKGGCTVILISDMYLPQREVENMLRKCGYEEYDRLYLSSTLKLKKSTGRLYDYVLSDLKIRPRELLHIGDSKKTDFVIPRLKGIKSFHVPRKLVNASCLTKKDIFESSNDLFPFINNNLPRYAGQTELFRLAYETLGPLLLGFCTWLHKELTELGAEKTFFLARDMVLVIAIYRKLYGENGERYLEVSRHSLREAYLLKANDLSKIFGTMMAGKYTFGEILRVLGIDAKEIKLNVDLTKISSRELMASAEYAEFCTTVLKELKGRKNYTLDYLRQEGMIGGDKTVIVDLGWRGTIQKMLEELLKRKLQGLYFGNFVSSELERRAKGYWINSNIENAVMSEFSLVFLLESMVSESIGSTVGYNSASGKYIPEHSSFEVMDANKIYEIHRGVLAFVEDYDTFKPKVGILDKDDAIRAFQRLAYRPTPQQVKLLSSLSTIDEFRRLNAAIARPFYYYLRHPRVFFADAKSARWREGFIVQILPFIRDPHQIVKLYHLLFDRRIKKRFKSTM